jgi:hypothetical protein
MLLAADVIDEKSKLAMLVTLFTNVIVWFVEVVAVVVTAAP